jgi:hypothetical protein
VLTFHVSSLHLLHFVGATMREVATCCQPDSPRRVRGDEAHTPPLVLACFSMAARSQARFRGETIWPTRIAVNGIDCRLRSDGSDRRPRTGFVVNGRRTVAQNAARNPGVVYRMGANSLIYNNRHENFSFFQKALDSAETYPYVLASRRRPHGWPAGPGAPGSTGRFDRLGP